MKRIRVIYWLVVALIAFAFLNLGLDLRASHLGEGPDSSNLMITYRTSKSNYQGIYNRSNYYRHQGINLRYRNDGVSVGVGIITPVVVVLLALLFEPAIVKRIGKLTGET